MKTTKTILAALAGLICLPAAQSQQGLVGEYFNGQAFNEKKLTRTDAQINFVWDNVAPVPGVDPHQFSIRWRGRLKTPRSGVYLFRAQVDDGIRVRIGGQTVIDAWGLHDSERFSGKIALEAGRFYDLEVDYYNGMFEGEIQLYWQLPGDEPHFGGLFGYNDRLIENQYFFQPVPPPVAQPAPPAPQPAQTAPPPKKTPAARPAAPKPAAAKPAPAPADTAEKYLPKNVLFVQSKSELLPESYPELDRLAGFLLRNPALRLCIEGHTDNLGDPAKNQILSEERAQTVAAYLTGKGVAADRLTARGYGDTRPLVRDNTADGRAKNRRVEFVIQ